MRIACDDARFARFAVRFAGVELVFEILIPVVPARVDVFFGLEQFVRVGLSVFDRDVAFVFDTGITFIHFRVFCRDLVDDFLRKFGGYRHSFIDFAFCRRGFFSSLCRSCLLFFGCLRYGVCFLFSLFGRNVKTQ